MARSNEVKDRFRERLAAADARSNGFRQKLLEDGTRALRPVIEVLTLMAEVLNEEDNVHGSIHGIEPQIDQDNFIVLCAKMRGNETEQKIKIKYGPELGGSNTISVSGLNQRYNEQLVPGAGSVAHIGRVIGSDIHLDENRGAELAEVVRDVVEDFYAAQIEQRSHFAAAA
ncbi:hypothetical protein Q8W71_08675 [Methylobacterium sp. NEAU 140]|uniref:hypothetical protein n=1 Tax=Methylobacterium sp. NEAU 140 TaxID=3064945 RepID=UPI002734DE61|nr:hypothetical protein [Methylobacterium sp. NEAU 140]MDP4022694.1 hypothetical protein [Methylobacterium sp. NEAU 140]